MERQQEYTYVFLSAGKGVPVYLYEGYILASETLRLITEVVFADVTKFYRQLVNICYTRLAM